MKLTPAQLEQFDRDGYLFFPSLFSGAEIKTLADAVPGLYAQRRWRSCAGCSRRRRRSLQATLELGN